MNKTLKKTLVVLSVLLVIGLAIGGYFIWRHNVTYIGGGEALRLALESAGVSEAQLIDREVEFESTKYSKWYDVEFETHSTEYDYSVDALSGEILNSSSKPND